MDILEQLEQRIAQLLDNMSLMQMEIDELSEKNEQLAVRAEKADLLEAEVAKIRSEQTVWQNRLRHLLGRIDEVSDQGEAPTDEQPHQEAVHEPISIEIGSYSSEPVAATTNDQQQYPNPHNFS